MVEWSHTQTSMRFIANLQRLLSSDSRVSYSSLVSSLTTVSKNLGLGTLELNGNQRSEVSSHSVLRMYCLFVVVRAPLLTSSHHFT